MGRVYFIHKYKIYKGRIVGERSGPEYLVESNELPLLRKKNVFKHKAMLRAYLKERLRDAVRRVGFYESRIQKLRGLCE